MSAMAVLAALCLTAAQGLAQHAPIRPRPLPKLDQRQGQKNTSQSDHTVQNHAGDWLRRYKDLPPDKQREALQNDPDFRKLPPQRQTQLLQRLQRFSSLPPDQQNRILSRMETWEHLTHDQKLQAKNLFQQIQQLPPPRRQMLSRAVRSMRDLTPEQREQLIDSDGYKSMFSDHERELLSGAAQLPLAPGEGNSPAEAPEE